METKDQARQGKTWWIVIAALAFGPLLLFLDSRARSAWPDQYLLGLLTFAAMWLCSRILPRSDRYVVWVCVVVATGFEVLGSLVWGAYHYRFGGIPLFVPFGHGLIYVVGIAMSSSALIRRHERRFTTIVLAAAALWALAGLTVLPAITSRIDVHGLVWLPLFAYVLLRSPRKAFFAALFIATTDIELFGTWLHSWMWAEQTPFLHIASGNPPSAIAGGYAVIDGTVMWVAMALRSLAGRCSRQTPQLLTANGLR